MRERLEKFIRTEGLTPSRFAEIMGVQPSSISHILSGRNKPSFDFIEKMLLRFPKVNPDWLLLGKGVMYRASETTSPILQSIPSIPNAPQQPALTLPFSDTPTNSLPFETSAAGEARQTELSSDSSQISNSQKVSSDTPRSTPEPPKNKPILQNLPGNSFSPVSEEMIDQIVIFLKDKTFISYRPK